MLTQVELKKYLEYNPDTGIFIRKLHSTNPNLIGKVAGYVGSKGYIYTSIHNKKYTLHRLAWLYMTGKWPKEQVDHINQVKNDNRWANLREATNSQNHFNRPKQKNNTTGFKGIWIDPRNPLNPYVSQIMVNRKKIFLGCFSTPELAHEAYCRAAEQYHGEYRGV